MAQFSSYLKTPTDKKSVLESMKRKTSTPYKKMVEKKIKQKLPKQELPFDATNLGITVNTIKGIGEALKGMAQSTARSFLAAGTEINEQLLTRSNERKKFGESTYTPTGKIEKKIFGTDQPVGIKTVGEEYLSLLDLTEGGQKFKEKYGEKLAIPVGVFGVGLDVWVGGADDLFKVIAKTDKIADAIKIGKTLKVPEDLLEEFAQQVIKAKTPKEGKAVVNWIDNTIKTTRTTEQMGLPAVKAGAKELKVAEVIAPKLTKELSEELVEKAIKPNEFAVYGGEKNAIIKIFKTQADAEDFARTAGVKDLGVNIREVSALSDEMEERIIKSKATQKSFEKKLRDLNIDQGDVETRVKGKERLVEKLEKYAKKGKGEADIPDVLGGRVYVKRENVANQIREIKSKFNITEIQDNFTNPNIWGYRGANIQAIDPETGLKVEIQVHTPESARASKEAHILYEKWGNKDVREMSMAELLERQDDIIKSNSIYSGTMGEQVLKVPTFKQIEDITKVINEGGITYNFELGKNLAGEKVWAVGVFPHRASLPIPVSTFSEADVIDFIENNADIFLNHPGLNLGGWADKGNIYLDISRTFKNFDDAKAAGIKFNQISISDLSKIPNDMDNAFINVGGTGERVAMTDEEVFTYLDDLDRKRALAETPVIQKAPGEVSPTFPPEPTEVKMLPPSRTVAPYVDMSGGNLIAGDINPANLGAYDKFKKSVDGAFTNIVEYVQDSWVRVKNLLRRKGTVLPPGLTPYEQEILMKGRIGARLEEAKNVMTKIDKDLVRTAKSYNIPDSKLIDDVNDYLIARHAPERNLKLGEKAAGITTKEAFDKLTAISTYPHYQEVKRIANEIYKMNESTLNTLLDSQVISKEVYDRLKGYKYHVPLNRVFSEEEDVVDILINKGLDVKWSGLFRAKGSERQVADIMTNVLANYEAAVVRAEKNLVDLSVLNTVRANGYFGGLFEESASKAIGKTFGGDIILKNVTDPNILTLKENGKTVLLKINDSRLASALRGINKQKLDGLTKAAGTVSRWFSSLATRFNPEFAFSNKIRDLQEAVVYVASKGEIGVKNAPRLFTDDIMSQKAVYDYMVGNSSEGAKLYKQMKMDGGTTGGLGLSTRKEIELDMAEIRQMNRSNPKKVAKKVVDMVDKWNTLFEDSTRFSVYKRALANGVSREKAAVLAKEATVNFNKMGTGGPVINAMYMFANASIQGSAKLLNAMKNPKVATAVVSTVGASVFAVSEWNNKVDEDWRDKVSKWDRMNSLAIVVPSTDGNFKYITIPVSWGIKPIKVAMDYFSDLTDGKSRGIVDGLSGVVASFVEAYNPVGGTDFVSAITPTFLDVPVAIQSNKSWTGNHIRPDFNAYTPASLAYFDSLKKTGSGRFFIEAMDELSKKTGGRIEVSPADVNYAYEQLIGGAGRFGTKILNDIFGITKGEIPVKEIPFVSRFFRSVPLEETGTGSAEVEEVKRYKTEETRKQVTLKMDAEAYYEELKKMPKAQAAEMFNKLIEENPLMAKKINEIIAEEKRGLTYTERIILTLGVEDGERARYIKAQIDKLPTKEEKARYYQNLIDKKIVTKTVGDQIKYLLSNP